MRELIIMRHAQAANSSYRDFDRELTDKGLQQATQMGTWLQQQGFQADVIISSSAVRAYQTAERVATEIGFKQAEIIFQESIYNNVLA
jgi:phosphohistidine phosphatase